MQVQKIISYLSYLCVRSLHLLIFKSTKLSHNAFKYFFSQLILNDNIRLVNSVGDTVDSISQINVFRLLCKHYGTVTVSFYMNVNFKQFLIIFCSK